MDPEAWCEPIVLPDSRTLAYLGPNAELILVELATGQVRRRFRTDGWQKPQPDYDCGSSLDHSPDGRYIATHVAGSILVWDVREAPRLAIPPSDQALTEAWNALASADASVAFAAIRVLAAALQQSLPFLRERFNPTRPPDPTRVTALIAALANPDYQERERAAVELEAFGPFAVPMMLEALRTEESPEAANRMADILKRVRRVRAEEDRAVRAVEAVEWMNTPDAVKLLEMWACGIEGRRLAEEAKSALARVKHR